MKIIDLLNKIANGEEVPRKIKYDGKLYFYCVPCKIYEIDENDELCGKDLYNMLDNLNDEVEIIEEEKKIPEKINNSYYHLSQDQQNQLFKNTISEIIDYLEYLKSKGE